MENRKVALITGITGQDGSYLKKGMMCMALSAVLQPTIVSVSLIWKVNLTSISITQTSATL